MFLSFHTIQSKACEQSHQILLAYLKIGANFQLEMRSIVEQGAT